MIHIIGGKGFVGSACARACRSAGLDYEIIDRSNYSLFRARPCDVLINANGNSKKYLATRDPEAEFQASVATVRASLEDFDYKKYVLISTCDVYPDCSSPLTTKEDCDLQVATQSPYGFHKYLAELCVKHHAHDWLIFRLGGSVGPGLKKNPVFDILTGGPLWLDPSSELQFLSTDEAAEIILKIVALGSTGQTYNVCGEGTMALSAIIDLAGARVSVQPGSPRVRYEVSIDKVKRLVPVSSTVGTIKRFVTDVKAGRLSLIG